MHLVGSALWPMLALPFGTDALAWGGIAADDPGLIVTGAAIAFALPAVVAGLWVLGCAIGRSLGATASTLACAAATAVALAGYLHPDSFVWLAAELSRRL